MQLSKEQQSTIMRVVRNEMMKAAEEDLLHLVGSGVNPTPELIRSLAERAADATVVRLVEAGILKAPSPGCS